MTDLEHELRKVVEGDVRFDAYSRLLYSTDASMYQVEPVGVVIPRHAGDVQAVLDVANRSGTPVLPRGGGTSLTGQAVNRAIVVDFSPHMNRLLELNAEEGWARVEPGLVQDELNHLVRPHGLLFGPDTSTSSRATLGGMLGNNPGGAHSIAYGLTVDHVLELRVLLADGTEAVLRELGPAELGAGAAAPGRLGQIHREVARIGREYGEEIRARYPAYWRRVAGYNLTELVADRPLNLARLAVGSEGTLLTIVEAKVRLVPRPRRTGLCVIHYRELQEALESSQAILDTQPYAVELTDKMILDLARGNLEQSSRMGFVEGDPAAILIVEYAGEDEPAVRARLETLRQRRERERFGYAAHVVLDPAEQQSIWKLRKAARGLEQVRAIATEITELVLEYGGTISSEHGDGRARSPFLERVYGPRVFEAHRALKRAFDPRNLLNPGNIVDSPGLTEHLRYGPRYTTAAPATLLDFSAQGGFAAAVEMCNGVGVCRKTLEGTMCPSYMATRDEEHSTRGRANALRAV